MKVLPVRNAHEGLPRALQLLEQQGERRTSRNGPVIVFPTPVTTVFEYPEERVIFWKERDANPFFHLYESLWMLAGRHDVAPLVRYVKRSIDYSDDGITLYGAYGYRWRSEWMDQLRIIANRLKEDPTDRRCVLQMWDAEKDLGHGGRDFPCNVMATFQRDIEGKLNLVVFNRSNDIIWGLFGANVVQFSTLLEYMALWIGCPIGTYTQVSVNWHAYLDTFEKVKYIRPDRAGYVTNPYLSRHAHVIPMEGAIRDIDDQINTLLGEADNCYAGGEFWPDQPWMRMIYCVLYAHEVYRREVGENKFRRALDVLREGDPKADWIVAAQEWILRRWERYS